VRGPAHRGGVRVRLTGLIVAAALAAAGVAGCAGGHGPPGTAAAGNAGASANSFPAAVKSAAAGAPATASGSARPAHRRLNATDRLVRALRKQFRNAGRNSGGAVYDITAGRSLFGLGATVKRPPASVEKLYTTVAALTDLGPQARFHTEVRGTGSLGTDGIWHGNLYLRGDGDPTFGAASFNRIWELGEGSTPDRLVDALRRAGIRRVDGSVIGDPTLFDDRVGPPSSDFEADLSDMGGELSGLTFDHGESTGKLSPGALAASKLAVALRKARVFARATPRTERTPQRAKLLASVASPPLTTILKLMDVPSDDFYAETLTKDLGARFAGRGTTAAGADVIGDVISTGYGLHPRIVDGSGLSRSDRSSPAEVVDLLRAVDETPVGDDLARALPTVGVDGTVRTIATGTDAEGSCVAKTGTLDDVTNLAGYCTASDHQLLAFALFLDGPPNWTALPIIGRMVAAIAAY
jgi:D-alanyl-D-alanine carboxypeptidase/D-alanyl-D-alanine-endopeptidase (penicillin-binding protein 4)